MAEERGWLRENWTTPVILLGIFLFALYLRAYFPWDLAWPNGLISGGSDSYYHRRIIETIVATGHQLTFDPLLNYPAGLINPRPPLYQWSTAVVGMVLGPLFGDTWRAVTFTFLLGTAVWGALTIFPLYFLTKEAFGKRAAFLAAFFLAVMPAHLQRSPATNADHDAMILFFVVSGFFFLLRSLKALNEERWVEDWAFWRKAGRASIRKGLPAFFAGNRKAVLYALLTGWCVTVIALTWQGWAYMPIIVLVYFLFQILVHRFRNQDPMGVLIIYGIAMGLPLLLSFHWYSAMNQIKVWYDVPAYLFLAAVGIGFLFTVTRDYPWALVVPTVLISGGLALAVLSVFYPAIATAFVSGAGYFVRSKAYSTIAEAQAPGLSQLILSFGAATYFLALFGLVWMARSIPKRPTPDFLFVVVWAITAIFMAQSAARFIFNAAPAFAMSSAWVSVLLLEWLRFDEMRKTFRSLGGSRIAAVRRSVKARHVLGSFLVIFLLLLPNVWYGVDASIPYERKAEFDRQVYDAYPSFLKPSGYTQSTQSGTSFYFGAFGYSLPLEKEYFPAAWAWLRSQDTNLTPENRPAFLSWWDYGFEAADAGVHPTVADNFLDGYHLAGSFITAQSEAEAIALLDLRLLEGDFRAHATHFGDAIRATLDGMGVPWAPIEDAFRTPDKYAPIVENDPFTYGHYEAVQGLNAQYIYGRVVLMNHLDVGGLATLNHALTEVTGKSIRYFAVDTRLFPLDGQNTGIFYAPAKLSDHRILELRDGRTIPIDFFDINAQTQRGVIPLGDVTGTDTVSGLAIKYKEMFYRSMFYRAYVGFAPSDAGQNCSDCIPGIASPTNQQIQNVQPLPAWDLRHFKMVYRTAYYNPYPGTEIQNHTDAWRAISFQDAQDLQGKINRGEATGVVDASAATALRRGALFVKYYHGAFVNGTVTLGGVPFPGVRVTVHDEFGVPHDSVVTGEDGRYTLTVPFGAIHIQATIGAVDPRTLVGPTTVGSFELTVSDAASMRQNIDENADGIPDWLIARDIDVASATLEGSVYADANVNGRLDAGEPTLGGAVVTLKRVDRALNRTGTADAAGRILIPGLYAGAYNASVAWRGRTITVTNVTIARDQAPMDLAVRPATVRGFVLDAASRSVPSASVTVVDTVNGTTFRATSGADGSYAFTGLLSGAFDVTAGVGIQQSVPDRLWLPGGPVTEFHNITVYASASVDLRTSLGGAPQGSVTVEFTQRSAARLVRLATTGPAGQANVFLPAGTWDVHARHYSGTTLWAFVGTLTVAGGDAVTYEAGLEPGASVTGRILNADNVTESLPAADVAFRNAGGEFRVRSDASGIYLAQLPFDAWTVQISRTDFTFLGIRVVAADTTLDFPLARGVPVTAHVFREFGDGSVQLEDPVPGALVSLTNGTQTWTAITQADGAFSVGLPLGVGLALRIDHPGYLPYAAPERIASAWQSARITVVARSVAVSGLLTQDAAPATDPTIPVRFHALGPGGVDATATLDGLGGYRADVAPGPYEILVDRDETGRGDVRLQLRDATTLTIAVGAPPIRKDLVLVDRMRVDGTVRLAGQPRSAAVRFVGPDVRTVNATSGSFTGFVVSGSYTVSANVTQGSRVYVAIRHLVVAAPTTLDLTLFLGTNVTGAIHDDSSGSATPVGDVPITFTGSAEDSSTTTSDAFGGYHLFLIGGTYTVSVDHRATSQVGGVTRHVRFTFSATHTVVQNASVSILDISLAKALDNTTVSGVARFQGIAPASTQIAFLAKGTNGINATAVAASDGAYAIALQPGSYDVYAFAPLEQAAFLGPLTLTAGAPLTFDFTMVPAIRVAGVTTVRDTVRSPAALTFTGKASAVGLRSDARGDYAIFLPADRYAVVATAEGAEGGLPVSYRGTATLDFSVDTVLNLALTKVLKHGVQVTWDANERTELRPGESANYTVTIRNTGNEEDTFALSVTAPDFTFDLGTSRVTLAFGADAQNTTAVRVGITAKSDARVNHGPISLNVRSAKDSATTESVILEVVVSRYHGLSAIVSGNAPTWDGTFLNYTIEVHNGGNAPESYHLSVPNLDEIAAAGWRASLVDARGTVADEIDLTIGANATQPTVFRLAKLGKGVTGSLAHVRVVDTGNPSLEAVVNVNVQMPVLAAEGPITAVGSGVVGQEPGLDLPGAAFLISFVAIVAAVAYLSLLRRRSR